MTAVVVELLAVAMAAAVGDGGGRCDGDSRVGGGLGGRDHPFSTTTGQRQHEQCRHSSATALVVAQRPTQRWSRSCCRTADCRIVVRLAQAQLPGRTFCVVGCWPVGVAQVCVLCVIVVCLWISLNRNYGGTLHSGRTVVIAAELLLSLETVCGTEEEEHTTNTQTRHEYVDKCDMNIGFTTTGRHNSICIQRLRMLSLSSNNTCTQIKRTHTFAHHALHMGCQPPHHEHSARAYQRFWCVCVCVWNRIRISRVRPANIDYSCDI